MFKRYQVKIIDNLILLPKGFSPGVVKKVGEGCLFVLPDRKGKLLFVSEEEKLFANIKEEALIVDCGRYYEIWNPVSLEKSEKDTMVRFNEISEKLEISL